MNVISIDPGMTSMGLYVYRSGSGYSICIRREENQENYDHLPDVRRAILKYAKGADMALVEDYAYGLPAGRAASSIEAGGVVRATLAEMGIPIVTVPIPTWKALTIKHHRKNTVAEKKEYFRIVMEKYGREFTTTDEADAFCIYQAVLRIWSGGVGGEPAERIRAAVRAVKETIAVKTA